MRDSLTSGSRVAYSAQPKTRDLHLGGRVLHKYSLKTNVFESVVSSIMKEAYVSNGLYTHGLFNGAC
jgi:hypothetical protein